MQLDRELFEQIVALLHPHMSENGRRTLITPAFSAYDRLYSQIDWSGSSRTFSIQLIKQLIDYGQVTPDEDALVLLLKTLRTQVGHDVQAQIDEIIATLPSDPPAEQGHLIPKAARMPLWATLGIVGLLLLAMFYGATTVWLIASTPPSTPTATLPTPPAAATCEYGIVVYDLATDMPIPNAKFSLVYGLDAYDESTNSEGRHRGAFSCTEPRPSYTLRVDAEGYLPYTNEFILQQEFVNIYLASSAVRLCPYGMTARSQGTSALIPNAKVQVELGRYHTTGYTDTEGYYGTELPCTTDLPRVRVWVSASGYEIYSADYFLKDEIQEVRLVPLE